MILTPLLSDYFTCKFLYLVARIVISGIHVNLAFDRLCVLTGQVVGVVQLVMKVECAVVAAIS